MPRSKRDRVVALTQTNKKGKEAKAKLIDEVREQADQHKFLWVFEVEHMRNNLLQEVRKAWKGSRCVPLALLALSCVLSGCGWLGAGSVHPDAAHPSLVPRRAELARRWGRSLTQEARPTDSRPLHRIFLGRNAVMRKGLGATPEDECRLGVHKVANVRLRLAHSLSCPCSSRNLCVQLRRLHDVGGSVDGD